MKAKKKKRILVTSALPYANGPIHLGHLAGAYLPADIYVRFHRLKKNDVIYICGSDEHGVPILLRARQEGVSPQQIVDRYHNMNKRSFANLGIRFDYYGRTSSPIHYKTSQEFFRRLAEQKVFAVKTEEQLFDPEANIFLADRFVRGTCPKCGYEDAYGDQCEKCGSSLSPMDLVDPRSAITNAKPILKKTKHWYLPLAQFQEKLEKWIDGHPEWKPNVLGQIRSWFQDGLRDRAVTRDLPWGVPVPGDTPQTKGENVTGKVLYVWFDAPIGYISATKEWAAEQGDPDLWKLYWQDSDTTLIHFIGKDNIVFHCLIFPAMLMAHGDFVLPQNVPANEFLNLEGNKLSTSRNYAVWLDEYLEKFPPDNLRYVLCSILPETKDSDFSWRDFQARSNFELADILGNFVHRTITFVHRYFSGTVPSRSDLDEMDKEALSQMKKAPDEIGAYLERFEFRQAVKRLMDLARFANKYFNDQAPWETRKTNSAKCGTTLNLCLELSRTLAIVMAPFLPFSADKIWKMLQLPGRVEDQDWDLAGEPALSSGHKIGRAEVLFPKIEDEAIEQEIQKLQQIAAGPTQQKQATTEKSLEEQLKERITYEDFQKLDLRVARVLEAEAVEKTDRLLRLQIDLGDEKRQIVAGIAKSYKPEDLVGKLIVVVANLEPATIRGVESNGMLLAASAGDSAIVLTVDREVAPGTGIK